MLIKVGDNLFRILDLHHLTPGNKRAHIQVRMRNIRTMMLADEKFRAEEDIERATLDEREMQYLYNDGDHYYFMDTSTFEQIHISAEALGDSVSYLIAGRRHPCRVLRRRAGWDRAAADRGSAGEADRPRDQRRDCERAGEAGYARDGARRSRFPRSSTKATGSASAPRQVNTSRAHSSSNYFARAPWISSAPSSLSSGIAFLIANMRLVVQYLRYRRINRGALLTWQGPKPPYYPMALGIGVALGLLVMFKLYRGLSVFGEAMMFIYYAYLFPLSRSIQRGFYEDGIWADTVFIPYNEVGGVSWREGSTASPWSSSRGFGTLPAG